MSMMGAIEKMKLKSAEYNLHAEQFKKDYQKEFETYITNKEISLEERFDFWLDAPDILKKQGGWIETYLFNGRELCLMDDLYQERHQTVDVHEDIVTEFQGRVDSEHKFDWFHGVPVTQEMVNQLMEDVLEKNVASFIYDW